MLLVDLKPLVGRLDGYCKASLENAAGLCISRGHYEITLEHLLHRLLDEPQADLSLLLRQNGVDAGALRHGIDRVLEEMRTGNAGRPAFSPLLLELLQDAWLLGSVDLGQTLIRSGAVLAALVARAGFYAGGSLGPLLRPLRKETLLEQFPSVCAGSIEGHPSAAGEDADAGAPGAIAKYCENFTDKARAGKIDPVFGRDAEIRQMVDILARRRKNNPICVGDPGVGKTAVVEGLALRIVEGDVPEMLKEVTLLGLDMGMLQAGASVKGEFENRLKGVIEEVKASATPIILFIDEAHTLIGAGGQACTSDAANLLKPALARGELRTIAATTWAEYKKYFEKDAALARRFQLVKLDEPDVATAVQILRGLRERYQEVHQVAIRDDALVAAAELSSRYITGRQLPDKAVDLLDTACARVKVLQHAKPDRLEDTERRMQALEREARGLRQDVDHRQPVDAQRFADIDAQMGALAAEAEELRARWQAQRAAAQVLRDARAAFGAARREQGMQGELPEAPSLQALEAELVEAEQAFAAAQGDEALVRIDVDPEVVAKVVSDWTGVPVGKMQRDRASTVLGLADALKRRIRGQDAALDQVAEIVKTASSGLNDPRQPLGVFLLVGPSGVGKTETALAVADLLFGDEKSTVVVNMSEFQERHNVSRLIGSPPGYVGYGEGGLLTEAVRQRPYSVVLLDEVEKAHLDVLNLFYQVFDKGMLSDGEGKEIDFANTVIFLTSNLATDVITEMTQGDEPADPAVLAAAIRPLLSSHFKPALLARMTIVPYVTLDAQALGGIVRLKLERIALRLTHNNKARFTFADAVVERIAARCTEVETGARNIDFILRGNVLPLMSQQMLQRMGSGEPTSAVHLDVDAAGEFTVHCDAEVTV